jgi:two-component system OmpR family sensor kinase
MRAGLRLDDVVTAVCDLLDVALGCPSNVEQTDVSQMLAQELEAHQDAVVMRGVELRLEGESGVVCAADCVSLRRAIRALLQNATSRSPRESLARAAVVSTPRGVQISVRDGVSRCVTPADDSLVPRGAEERVADARSNLGLAIAAAVANAHGGGLVLTDAPGGGLEARIELLRVPRPRQGSSG